MKNGNFILKRWLVIVFISFTLLLHLNGQSHDICGNANSGLYEENQYSYYLLPNQNIAPITLNIFYHVIRKTNGTGGYSSDKVNDVFRNMISPFEEHNIFFKWNECEIGYIDDDTFYNGSLTNSNNISIFNVNVKPNNINIYLFPEHIPSILTAGGSYALGAADGIGGIGTKAKLWVTGPSGLNKTICHEVGHVLGLYHTSYNVCNGLRDDPTKDNDPNYTGCNNLGDRVCDTPADPLLLEANVNINCVWNGIPASCTTFPGSAYHPHLDNIMSNNRLKCVTRFTKGQGVKMHDRITNNQYLKDCLSNNSQEATCECPGYDLTISSDIIWNIPKVVNQNVTIKSGKTLTITSVINFSKNSSIKVESGAKLVIDGGTLTKCSSSNNWKGIKVKADFTYVWGFGPPNTEVILKNGAIIEYAETGIDAVDQLTFFNTSDIGGAKITIEGNSSISNCEIGVRLGPIYGYQELSSIDNATFNNNEIGVQINSNNGLNIKNSTFKYNNHLDIQGISSSMVADNNTFNTSIEFSSNYPIFTGSNFKNNDFFVQNGTITNTTVGAALYIDAMSNSTDFYIQNNQFFGTGIQIVGELDFDIRNNDFHESGEGTWISESGDSITNFVTANNFYDNVYGNSASGINDTEYQKNCFNGTDTWDIEVNENASIHESQGIEQNAAGNCFSKHIVTANTSEHFDYYVLQFTVPLNCTQPGSSGNFSKKDASQDISIPCGTGNNIYSTIPARYRDCTYTNTTDLKQMITYLRNEILLLEANTNMDPWIKKWLIAKYKRCLDRAIKLKAKDDLEQKGKDSTIVFLLSQPEFRYQSMAYGLVMENNDLTRASTILNNLPISDVNVQEFVNVQNTYLDYLNSKSNYILTTSNNSLIYNAGLRKHPLAGFARTVYHTITGQKIPVTLTHLNGNPNIRAKEVVKPDISIFPNPTENGVFNIELASFTEGDEIISLVYNLYGQIIQRNPLIEKQSQIKIPNVPSGLYLVQIMVNNNITYSRKLIVK